MLNFPSLADFYTSTVVMEEAASTTSNLYELGMALLIVSAVELFVEAAKMAHRVYLSEWVTGLAPWGTTFKHGDSSIRARIAGFSLKDIGAALNEKIEADDEPAKKAAEARQHREERKKKATESKQLRSQSIDRTPQQEQEKNQAVVVPGTPMDGLQKDKKKKKGDERDVETGQQAPAAAGATSEYSVLELLDHERNLVKHNMWWALPRVLCDVIAFALSE